MLATMGLFSMLGKTTLGPLVIPVVSSSSSVSLEDNAKVEAANIKSNVKTYVKTYLEIVVGITVSCDLHGLSVLIEISDQWQRQRH